MISVTLMVHLCLLAGTGTAQQAPRSLIAHVSAGESLRYRLEGTVQYIADADNHFSQAYKSDFVAESCQFWISSVAVITPEAATAAGNTPVAVTFSDSRITDWQCPGGTRSDTEKELRALEAVTIKFQIGPHGEVSSQPITPAESNKVRLLASDLLAKLAADLLETRLGDAPVVTGNVWKPHGQFLSQNRGPLRDLELGGRSTMWKETIDVGGHQCALLETHYVFTPQVTTATPTTPNGVVRQKAVNAIAGDIAVSLLFDLRQQSIVWLKMHEEANNQVRTANEDGVGHPNTGAVIKLKYEGTAALIPQENALEWLVAIKQFEDRPQGPPSANAGDSTASSLAQVAAESRAHVGHPTSAANERLENTPAGFTRWSSNFCANSQFCGELSLAMPGEVRVLDQSQSQIAYSVSLDDKHATVTVGPVLPRDHAGLTPEEELAKHSQFFLANLWMAYRPATAGMSQPTTIDGYPSLVTPFRAKRNDLVSVQGKLAILLSPWGDAYPITCAWEDGQAGASNVCEEVLGLVRLKR